MLPRIPRPDKLSLEQWIDCESGCSADTVQICVIWMREGNRKQKAAEEDVSLEALYIWPQTESSYKAQANLNEMGGKWKKSDLYLIELLQYEYVCMSYKDGEKKREDRMINKEKIKSLNIFLQVSLFLLNHNRKM